MPGDRRLVVVILRGALDGLAAVPPHGDKDYAVDARRPGAADQRHGRAARSGRLLRPASSPDQSEGLYDARQLIVFHNICSPYRDRSHFDGQNVLEAGGTAPHLLQDGWLNRALTPMGLAGGEGALAIAQTPPLMLSGKVQTASWMPAVLPAPDELFLNQVRALYASDPVLEGVAVQRAGACRASAQNAMDDPAVKKHAAGQEAAPMAISRRLFQGAGKLLAAPNGPRVATLEASGWDTHVAEGAADGQLARRLAALDAAIDAMRTAMGPDVWNKTAVVMATEFGRTVHPNGSGGTDHGTGGAAFLFGGAVAGGTVQAEWVGLSSACLQGWPRPARPHRSARPVQGRAGGTDGCCRAVQLESTIFPDSASAAPIKGLIRT